MLSDLFHRILAIFRHRKLNAELQEELQYHLERQTEKHIEAGLNPREAKRQASLLIGGVEQVRQQCREAWGAHIVDDVLHDFRFALRQLGKNPGFAFIALVVFSISIAASTAIFAFVNAAMIKPLPYRDPSQLVALFERLPVGDRYHLSHPDYLIWKNQNHAFKSLDIYQPGDVTLGTQQGSESAPGMLVSADFFQTLGVTPVLGRSFQTGEDQLNAAETVILSNAAWRNRFGGDKRIIGHTIALDGDPYVVIGILPPDFHFAPAGPAEFWRTIHGLCADNWRCHPFYGVARLKPGWSIEQASAELEVIARQIAKDHPDTNRDRNANVVSLADAILGDVQPVLLVLLSGAVLLSFTGFVNVFSLLLVRAESRRRELALRIALGASHSRLVRQFAVEGFLLAAAGSLLGLVAGYSAIGCLYRQVPKALLDSMPYLGGLQTSWHLPLGVMVLSICGGLLFTAAPLIQFRHSDKRADLNEGGRTGASRHSRNLGSWLVVFELALTMVIMISAGLFAKSFFRMLHADMGLVPDHLAVIRVLDPSNGTDAQHIALERQVLSRMAALPGVASVGISEELAIEGGEQYKSQFSHYRVFGRRYVGQGREALNETASVGYFETLRTRLKRGRYFTEADDASIRPIAIINQTMANEDFPGEDPIGKRVVNEFDPAHPLEIIGVIDDLKDGPLNTTPTPSVYKPFNQDPHDRFYVTVRTSSFEQLALHSMVTTIHAIDSGLVADREGTMSDRIDNSESAYLQRSAALLVTSFAVLALVLATVGLYGVVSYSVGRRTREIGVRIALGAQLSSIYRLILQEAAWLAISGLGGGLVCSLILGRLLRRLLYGVSPWDITTQISVSCVLMAAALLASYIPARRAASVLPTEALRAE